MKQKVEIFMQRYNIRGMLVRSLCDLRINEEKKSFSFQVLKCEDCAEAILALIDDFDVIEGRTFEKWREETGCGNVHLYEDIETVRKRFVEFLGEERYRELMDSVFAENYSRQS